MDLVERQDIINALKENSQLKMSAKTWSELTSSIISVPSVQKWIPCKECQPKLQEWVLVTNGIYYQICRLTNMYNSQEVQWESSGGRWYDFQVWTDWMPMIPKI